MQAGIKQVSQGIANEIESKHEQHKGKSREEDEVG